MGLEIETTQIRRHKQGLGKKTHILNHTYKENSSGIEPAGKEHRQVLVRLKF